MVLTSSSWLAIPASSDFPLENLPYGVFSPRNAHSERRVGTAVGDYVLDLAAVLEDEVFNEPSLNAYMARGPAAWRATRQQLSELLTDDAARPRVEPHLLPRDELEMHLPIDIADYVDFYASEQHATNVGRLFRPDSEPLTPNWKHLPIGYHGRAGTVVVSGTPIVRPNGQRRAVGEEMPSFGPSLRLDIEAEVGFVVGVPSALGQRVAPSEFRDHVFGVVLLNDWSARDIQAWEYVPLGPFLGKSFATSISPWVVTLDALEAARLASPPQVPAPLPYLKDVEPWGLDLSLEIEWNGEVVAHPPFAEMYWSPAQQLAHMTVNGASLRTGDLFASGTVSGREREERGSFLELSWNGTEPVVFADGSSRTFLEDGDEVSIRASAPSPAGGRIGFGEVRGQVQPAL